jgi:hypothetical protein
MGTLVVGCCKEQTNRTDCPTIRTLLPLLLRHKAMYDKRLANLSGKKNVIALRTGLVKMGARYDLSYTIHVSNCKINKEQFVQGQ